MTSLSLFEVYTLFAFFGFLMMVLVWMRTRTERHADGFLVADRNVSIWQGALSIAVSWVWAPAVFICSLQAYTKGLPGVLWFTVPNVLCFFTFAIVAYRLRHLMPEGYTLPEFIFKRFGGNRPAHLAFLTIAFGYQLGAIVINAVAGGTLLHLASGIDVQVAILGMVGIALAYSILGGLKASILTDVVQMVMILGFAFVLVPWAVFAGGGWATVQQGLAGLSGDYGNLFDPWVAYTMGIPMTISLIAGPISDQMFHQRTMAVRRENVVPVFVRGGLIFALVPLVLSILGFIGVTLLHTQGLVIADPQMVGPVVIAALLPKVALFFFILMAFAGLCSTMDSAFCAISSLGTVDVFKHYGNPRAGDKTLLKAARIFMVMAAIAGGGIALLQPQLLWVFFIYGTLSAAGLIPSIAALFVKDIEGKDVFLSIVLSVIIALPLSVYANVSGNEHLNVLASASGVLVGLVVCGLSILVNRSIDLHIKAYSTRTQM